jgi:hypothetical protein
MSTPRVVPTLLGVAVLLSCLAAAQAEQDQNRSEEPDKKAATDKPKPDSKEASAELTKAQAEVKTLEAELQKQREQLRATAEQLREAHARVAKLGGHEEEAAAGHRHGPGAGFGRRGRRAWAAGMWGPPPWHPRHRFAGPDARRGAFGTAGRHGPDGAASSDLERKVDRLQREVEQLRHDLQQKK